MSVLIEIEGDSADDIQAGKAVPLAVVVYYPEINELGLVCFGVQEESVAIMRKFNITKSLRDLK